MADGKKKKIEEAVTRPLKPVPDAVHKAHLEFNVFVYKGTVEVVLVCDCGQRAKVWEKAVPGFHVPKKD